MTQTINMDGLNALAEEVTSGHLVDAEGADSQPNDLDELDDGVEAVIIRMDRTTAEHLFLRAQRPV